MRKILVLATGIFGIGMVLAGRTAAGRAAAEAAAHGSLIQSKQTGAAGQVGLASSVELGSTFTYQGLLTDGGSPANGFYDFQFLLLDAINAGSQVGTAVALEDVSVADGLLMVELDFGESFDGRALWLEIQVRHGSDTGGYTVLAPRQAVTAAPYALSLRPGATISGAITSTQQGVLNLGNGQGHGLLVSSVGNEGVLVSSAGGNGVQVDSAGSDGLYVGSAGGDGFYISAADGHGVHIGSVGSEAVYVGSAGSDGVYVASAGGNGVKIVSADDDGVEVDFAAQDGFQVDIANGNGVLVNSAGANGVDARSISASNFGGYFQNTATGGRGVYAEGGDDSSSSLTSDLELGGSLGVIRSDSSIEGSLRLLATGGLQIDLDEDNDTSNAFVITGNAGGSVALIVDEAGNTTVFGNHTVIGTKSAVVDTAQHGPLTLYALESPENWFEDFGSTRLEAGEITVPIEPIFAATVNMELEYHVFLTPLGDCALYVAEKSMTAFTVRAHGGSNCAIDFDYRMVARRLGYENLRLEPVDLGTLGEEK